MKQLVLSLTTLALITLTNLVNAQAPNWAWAKSAGNISVDYSNATCADANGNVFITGTFQGPSITFGNYTLYNTATGTLDVFIVKYDGSGNVLWAASGGGTNDDWSYGICTDANGNTYITGYFRSPTITFGTMTLTNVSIYAGETDFFVSKYDATGSLIWSKREGGSRNDKSWGMCTDLFNNLYVMGAFDSDTIIFGNDTLINFGNTQDALFIAKYDTVGNILWAEKAGGDEFTLGQGICSDLSGNVYVTGYFRSTSVFGNDTIFAIGNTDMFVAMYNANGNEIWAKSALKPIPGIDVLAKAIVADTKGNVYITGSFQNSVSFGNDTLGNAGNRSIFLAKYDSSGNALWGRSPGGTGISDFGQSICSDLNNNVYITGYYTSSFLNFGGNPVINANAGYSDVFVAGYDSIGNALWAKNVGGSDYDIGMGICSSGSNVFATGYFGSYSLNFGNSTVYNNGSYDTYIAKLDNLTGLETHDISNAISIYPNPVTNELTISNGQASPTASLPWIGEQTVSICDVLGKEKLQQNYTATNGKLNLDVSNLPGGIYFLKMEQKGKVYNAKFIKE